MAAAIETENRTSASLDSTMPDNPWSTHTPSFDAPNPADPDSGSDYSDEEEEKPSSSSRPSSQSSAGRIPNARAVSLLASQIYTPISATFPDRTSTGSEWITPQASHTEGGLDTEISATNGSSPASHREQLSLVTLPPSANSVSHSRTSSQATELATVVLSPQSKSPVSDRSGSASPPLTPTRDMSPTTPQEARMSVDSFASIALSESSLDYDHLSTQQVDDVLTTPRVTGRRHMRKTSSLEIIKNQWGPPSRQSTLFDSSQEEAPNSPLSAPPPEDRRMTVSPRHSGPPSAYTSESNDMWREMERMSSHSATLTGSSSEAEETELDWNALDKTEEQEKEDKDLPEGVEDESTKFLLARLEQENAKFTAGPKATANNDSTRMRSNTRPPSIAHLKKLVEGRDVPSIRYSLAPDDGIPEEPPPMTELEFWAALVQDYPSTATRLPTLTTTKIHAGIPPPLRGVVWASMSGARDKNLDEAFETLQHEQSPYEGIINKDVGRSFPGVELFRDAEGQGQKMLGRVLKCFSLHDKDIGYCQGLGFLVGPLLMNMGEKEAFCVLVRLMDHYALRPSFLPSLSGLHMRIFQFSTLLKQDHPDLSAHLTELGVEPAYLSQWFLSCFAVTCPLPLLFRIYDVIFAEGANETVMRVALALFRRNEQKIMESFEFEEVMQLLLGRSLWDCYACNADELVDDFTSLGSIITHQRLSELEKEFENKSGEAVGQSAGFLPDVQAAASRFLGRLWSPAHGHTQSKGAATLSPPSADKDVAGSSFLTRNTFLRRSPSKQSITMVNENPSEDSTSSGSLSLASTAPTDMDVVDAPRNSQADSMSLKSHPGSLRTISVNGNQTSTTYGSRREHGLHNQIEDLLMALSEAQREQAQLSSMLQKEREERNDDHKVVRQLVTKLKKDDSHKNDNRRSMPPPPKSIADSGNAEQTSVAEKRRTLPSRPRPQVREIPAPEKFSEKSNDVAALLDQVSVRLETSARFSASFETKAQLRSALARTREQLANAEEYAKDLTDRAEFAENSLVTYQSESESLRAEVEELRVRVNDEFRLRQKLELQVQNMEIQIKMEARSLNRKERLERTESAGEIPTLSKIDTTAGAESGKRKSSISSAPIASTGLREFRIGRRDSVGSVASIRSMKGQRRQSNAPSDVSPSPSLSTTLSSNAVQDTPQVQVPSTPTLAVEPVPESDTPATPAPVSAPEPSSTVAVAPPAQPTQPRMSSLAPPGHRTGFARRTSSLVAKEVFATPQHEVVPDEALLLELVNAKTAEAQARQELDELRRAMALQRKRADETFAQMRAESAINRQEVDRARDEARRAREDADKARQEIFDASPLSTPAFSVPPTPANERAPPALASAADAEDVRKTESSPGAGAAASAVGAVGSWFWGRRTASTTKASIDPA